MHIITTSTERVGSTLAAEISKNPPSKNPSTSEATKTDWQESLKRAVRSPAELCRMLKLPPRCEAGAARATGQFPLFVPREYIARMKPGDPDDPLLRQVLPLDAETLDLPGFGTDPVGESGAKVTAGLLQKYEGRALLITTGACAVHCRYCFRRHFPYGETPPRTRAWSEAIEAIAADSSIHEVILSGGDPLTLPDEQLAPLAARLAQIPHVRRLRVHTRLPIMIPQRVNQKLLEWLCGTRLTSVVVIHANHVAEIDQAVAHSLKELVDAGLVVLNQSVLLRGVNDSVEALVQLCESLADLRVMPYYLHQLDRVAGAAHFEVPVEKGVQLVQQLRARLPGYCVPRYVQEVPGEPNKVVLA